MDEFVFEKDNYDLEGLLSKAERSGADFVFMIYDEATETYYMDRMEIRKYDNQFQQFIKRVDGFLESDEDHGLFVLIAAIQDERIRMYDGTYEEVASNALGDITTDEDCFFGMLLQYQEDQLIAQQAVFMNAHYEGDGRAVVIGNGGILTDRMAALLSLFE